MGPTARTARTHAVNRRHVHTILSTLAMITALASFAPAATPDQVGQWGPVLNWGVQGKHMVVQPTGKVLVWPTGDNARVWNPATGTFQQTPATFGDLHCAAQATLADGRTIVCGGVLVTPHVGIRVTALFDPDTNTWSQGTPMNFARWYGTVATLSDGKLLATSGDDENANRVTRPEIYDPRTNSWRIVNSASTRSQSLYPFMYLLPNGKVYESGTGTDTAFLDVVAGTWSNGPTNPFGSSGYSECQALYSRGKIIRAGGGDPAFARASVIDMQAASPRWREIAPMAFPRRRHNMVILADGSVLATGGTRSGDEVNSAILAPEIWNPVTETWSTMAAMAEARMYHSAAVLLPDGRVVTAGGEASGRLHAQVFSPPYLFKGTRPVITLSPALAAYGSQFTLQTANAASIDRVALLRPCAATHAIDMNERYVPLTFTVGTGSLQVTAPANGNEAPPGYYMLVIRNTTGVPSVAKWLRVDAGANLSLGSIAGRVTNATTGQPIIGAQVVYSAGSTVTSGTGAYSLDNVLPGEHSVTASAPGVASVRRSVLVTPGTQATIDFALAAPGGVAGRVTEATTGLPLAATVLFDGGSVSTNANGNYNISAIAPGNQTLSVVSTGYSSATRSVVIISGTTATANFVLTREPPHLEGEIQNATTRQPISGALVSYSGGSARSNSVGFYRIDNVAPGSHTLTAAAPGYASLAQTVIVTAGSWTAASFALVPNAPSSVTLAPVADALTASGSATNRGAEPALRVRAGSPEYRSFLKFVVPALAGPVRSAKLRLYCTDPSNLGGQLYLVASSWTETAITFANAPALTGTPLAQLAAVAGATWVEFDVAPAIAGNSTISFGLASTSTNSVYYVSREGAQPPQLVIQAPSPPSITGFTPGSAQAGTEIMIMGNYLGDVTAVRFNGRAAASFSLQSATMVHAVVPAGATTGRIQVVTPSGTATSATNFVVIVPTPTVFVFRPSHDALVFSGRATSNYGATDYLRVRHNTTIYRAYLKFNVTGLVGTVTSAKLRLYATDPSNAGGSVSAVGNTYRGTTTPWTETALNWNNAPTIPTQTLSTLGPVVVNTWVEMDVTAAVRANGIVNLAIATNATNSVYYSSKEGLHPPELVVRTGAAAAIAAQSETETDGETPLRFEALLATPNPFATGTTFAYGLPRAGRVRLEIYDVAGRLVRTLVDRDEPAGRNRVSWDSHDSRGQRASNGVYFYRLRYEREVRTGKVLLRR